MPGDGPLPKPHGKFTPAHQLSRRLTALGFSKYLVRKGMGHSGFACTWQEYPAPGRSRLVWRMAEDILEENIASEREKMLNEYLTALREDGWKVDREGETLFVYLKNPKARKQHSMPAEIPEDLGKPVYHETTKKLVGYIKDNKFVPVD